MGQGTWDGMGQRRPQVCGSKARQDHCSSLVEVVCPKGVSTMSSPSAVYGLELKQVIGLGTRLKPRRAHAND